MNNRWSILPSFPPSRWSPEVQGGPLQRVGPNDKIELLQKLKKESTGKKLLPEQLPKAQDKGKGGRWEPTAALAIAYVLSQRRCPV
jgi:hypothetical protein